MTLFERIVRASARRPGRVLAVVAVLAAVGCALALRLEPSAATDTLVGRGADTCQATERYRERFGDHSVVVLVRGELSKILLTSDLGRLIGLEGCLSGNKPADQAAPGGARSPCGRLARAEAGAGRVRARHVRQRVGRRDQRPDRGPPAGEGGGGRAGRGGRAEPGAGAGQVARRAGEARGLGAPARVRGVPARPAADQPALRPRADRPAERQRPELHLRAVLRPRRAARRRRRRASRTCSRRSARR